MIVLNIFLLHFLHPGVAVRVVQNCEAKFISLQKLKMYFYSILFPYKKV